MWPFCKDKEYEPGEAKCPKCGEVSTGHYQYGELVMAEFCQACKGKEAPGERGEEHGAQ